MEEIKTKILELIQSSKKGTLNRQAIEKALHMNTSSDFINLGRILDNMEENYELIRNRENRYLTPQQAQLLIGKLTVNRKGVGYIDREGQESVVIGEEFQNDALDGDTVLVRVFSGSRDSEVVKTIQHIRTHLIGTYVRKARGLAVQLDDEKFSNKILRVRVPKDFIVLEGLKVQLHIEKYGNPLVLSVVDTIGHKDDPGVDISAILLEHGIELEFTEQVLQEANEVAKKIIEKHPTDRKDLRLDLTITIDGDDSKDFDDAVSVEVIPEGWRLKVSIADVSYYVQEDSFLDKEAFQRGNSTYVVDRVVPMLPHILSNGICSLNPYEDRYAITCEMIVAKDGSVVGYEVYPSVICSKQRMTYHNVNQILQGKKEVIEKYATIEPMIKNLRDCADTIRKQRQKKGAIDFDTRETVIKVDEAGNPIDVKAAIRGHAEEIIEDCMILANVTVAHLMKQLKVPTVYRIHEEPQAKRMKEFVETSALLGKKFVMKHTNIRPIEVQKYLKSVEGMEQYPVLSKFMLRCMQKAKYDESCVGHFGLAESEYLHFTSPIRRYADLMVHRMLRKYVFAGCKEIQILSKDQIKVAQASIQASGREKESVNAEREVIDMKSAEYMMHQIGQRMEGIISSVTNFGFYVELSNTIEGLVRIASLRDDYYHFDATRGILVGERLKRKFSIGQKIMVTVIGADKDARTIEFEVAKKYNHSKKTEQKKDTHNRYASNRNGKKAKFDRKNNQKTEYRKRKNNSKVSDERVGVAKYSKNDKISHKKKAHSSHFSDHGSILRKGKNTWGKVDRKKK